MAGSIDRGALIELFERIDDALEAPQTICVIGAAAILGFGHVERQTRDIDVWRPASVINDRELTRAARTADVEIDRGGELPEGVYIQIINPGIVQLPPFADGRWATGEAKVDVWRGTKLTVESPPASIVAAARLVRGDDRDIDDCVFLVRSKALSEGAIARAIEAMEDRAARDAASENMVLLAVLSGRPAARTGSSREDDGGLGR